MTLEAKELLMGFMTRHKRPVNQVVLYELCEHLRAAGFDARLATHAGNTRLSDDKIVMDGQTWECIRFANAPNAHWLRPPVLVSR